MNDDRERALLARAHALAGVEDLAEEVTGILGGARAARLDPDALASLAGAALALGAGSLQVYRAEAARFADDRELLDAVEDAEADVAGRVAATRQLQSEVSDALARAREDLEEARDDLDAARAMPVHRPCDGCHAARAAAIAAAQERIRDAQERIAYCEQALRVLVPLAHRLAAALAAIRRVPGDLDGTYEQVYGHVRSGRLMPKDGDWLTGQDTAAAS
jgi:hypothetical protein